MSAYFVAKIVCDVLPLRIIPTMVFGAISYWMIGMHAHACPHSDTYTVTHIHSDTYTVACTVTQSDTHRVTHTQ